MNSSLETFSKNISSIEGYGASDFMQAASLHLDHLRKILPFASNEKINCRLEMMQNYLHHLATEDVRKIATKLIQDANYIDEILAGDQQNWESATPN